MPEPCASTQISCLSTEEKVHMTRWNLFRTIFELYPPLSDVDHWITAFLKIDLTGINPIAIPQQSH